jgi:hypothetical protein
MTPRPPPPVSDRFLLTQEQLQKRGLYHAPLRRVTGKLQARIAKLEAGVLPRASIYASPEHHGWARWYDPEFLGGESEHVLPSAGPKDIHRRQSGRGPIRVGWPAPDGHCRTAARRPKGRPSQKSQ